MGKGKIVLLTGRSSELGLILQTSQVARGSVDCSCFRHCSLITASLLTIHVSSEPRRFVDDIQHRSPSDEALNVAANQF